MIEIVIAFARQYWKQLAIAVTVFFVYMAGHHQGYLGEHQKFEEHLVQDRIAVEVAKAEYERKLRAEEEVTRNVTEGYAHAINELKRYYESHPNVKWVSSPLSSTDNTAVSEGATSINAGTQSNQVSTTGVTPLDCASDVLQLLYLQKWVRDQESIQ